MFAIPIVAAFASGAVGAVVAGTAGFAAYASVAGAVLSGVGALTGSKDVSRLGAVLSIGGGIAGALGGTSGAVASGVAESAGGFEGIGSVGAENMGAQAIEKMAETGSQSLAGQGASAAMEPAIDGGMQAAGDSIYAKNAAQQAQGLAKQFQTAPTVQAPTSAAAPQDSLTQALQPKPQGTLEQAASNMTTDQVQSWYDKALNAMKGVGKFAQQNPELLKIGGNMLSSMYGPQAERLDMEKSLMERARANLNAPIRLKYTPGG